MKTTGADVSLKKSQEGKSFCILEFDLIDQLILNPTFNTEMNEIFKEDILQAAAGQTIFCTEVLYESGKYFIFVLNKKIFL